MAHPSKTQASTGKPGDPQAIPPIGQPPLAAYACCCSRFRLARSRACAASHRLPSADLRQQKLQTVRPNAELPRVELGSICPAANSLPQIGQGFNRVAVPSFCRCRHRRWRSALLSASITGIPRRYSGSCRRWRGSARSAEPLP